jgi:glutamate racemase
MRAEGRGPWGKLRLAILGSTIGLFDSGVGGLSVWREVVRCLPHEATLYVADSVHCPYGPRSPQQIRGFARGITRFLIERGAKLVVVACNTASAPALEALRAEFDVPIVGMEPAVKPAAQQTRTGHVGVLATAGTLNGDLFRRTSQRHAVGVTLHVQVGEGLVERVEAGQADTPETEVLLRTYLQPMLDSGVDQIALGCTHYPLLLPVIRRIVPESVAVIDPAAAVARQVERVLTLKNLAAGEACVAGHRFFTSGQPQVLAALVGALAGREMKVERVLWENGELIEKSKKHSRDECNVTHD